MKKETNQIISLLNAKERLDDKEIRSPYRVNWSIYLWLLGISTIALITAIVSKCWSPELVDIVKNLSLGCFASTIVALLIEIVNVRDKNQKANSVYETIYLEPHLCVKTFLQCWSEICCVAYKDVEYKKESHSWLEWYDIYKTKFNSCEEERKKELRLFTYEHLEYPVDRSIKSLYKIKNQSYFLEVNYLYNNSIKGKIDDLLFEFEATKMGISHAPKDDKEMFSMLDAIVSDFENYISKWKDIDYLNYYCHKPYEFEFNSQEYLRALEKSKSKA